MSSIRARVAEFGGWWRPRRLSLAEFEGAARWTARIAVATTAGLCILIALHGIGVGIPFGADRPPGLLPIPRVAELLILFALGLGAATIALVSLKEPALRARLMLLPFSLLGLAVAGETRRVGRILSDDPLLITGAWVVGALALVALLAPRRGWLGRPAVVMVVASAPFVAVLVLYLLAGGESYRLPPGFVATHTEWADEITLHEAVMRGLHRGALTPAALALSLLFLWQVIETARATRDVATSGLYVRQQAWILLVTALMAKVVFLLVFMSGDKDSFVHSRHDGLLSWLLAIALVGGATLLLLRRGLQVEDREVSLPSTAAVAGLTVGFGLAGIAVILESAVALFHIGFARDMADVLIGFLGDLALWTLATWPFLMTAAGVLLLARRRTGMGVACLAFGVWGLPRAIALTGDLLSYGTDVFPVGRITDYIEGPQQYPGWVDAVTIDIVVTAALVVLAAAWHARLQRQVGPRALLFALALSTTVAHAGALIPGNWREGHWFYLGLAFPVAYGYLLGARPLNEQSEHRELKVLGALALTTFVLAVTTLKVFNADVRPGALSGADVGTAFMQVPLVFLLGLAAVVGLRNRARADETGAP